MWLVFNALSKFMKKTFLLLYILLFNSFVFAEENQSQSEHNHGAITSLQSKIKSPNNIRYFLPDLSYQQLDNTEQPKIGLEGYYALLVEQQQDNLVESEIQYFYKNGRPFSSKPVDLFSLEKTNLEIEPTPHPAEHNVYNSGKTWQFKVRFNGKPLDNSLVTLETENGTKSELKTDINGFISIIFPEDFTDIKPGLRANQPAGFRLTANTEQESKKYRFSFVGKYHVSPSHWQTLEGGFWVAVFGLLFGVLISLRLKSKPLKPKKYQG